MELDAMTNCWLVGWLDGSILNNVSLKNIALIPFVCRINLNEVEFAGVYFHYFGDIKLHTGYNISLRTHFTSDLRCVIVCLFVCLLLHDY